jgi:DNA-binding MarR family transcriptional regulator
VRRHRPPDHTARILAEWAQELPKLDTAPIAVAGRILRAARYLEREIERELAQHGLGIHEFNALSALRRIGPPHQMTPTELSHALLFTSGGLSKLLERLERSGLVRRERGTHDRRVTVVCLTDAGRDVQERAILAHLKNEQELLAPLSQYERDVTAQALQSLLVALELADARRRPALRRVAAPLAGEQ